MTQSSPFLSTHRRAKRSDAAAAANDTDNDDNDLTKKSSKKVRPHRIKVNFKMIGKWFSLKLGLTCLLFVFFKCANPGLFFIYFWSFQTNNIIFTTNQCEKCPPSIWHRDSNPQPHVHQSSPITTRQGLPPSASFCLYSSFSLYNVK